MRYLKLLLLFTLLIPTSLVARRNVLTKTMSNGTLAYVDNYEFKAESNDLGIKSLKYDITLVTFNDSVMVTSTIVANRAFSPDSVSVAGANNYQVEKIYLEPSGKKWNNRLRFYMTLDEFKKIAAESEAPQFVWHSKDNKYKFYLKPKDWNKQRNDWSFALEVIEVNK